MDDAQNTPSDASPASLKHGWFTCGLLLGLSAGLTGGWWLAAGDIGVDFRVDASRIVPQNGPQWGELDFEMTNPTGSGIGVIGDPIEAELAWQDLNDAMIHSDMPQPMPSPENAEPIPSNPVETEIPRDPKPDDSPSDPVAEGKTNEETSKILEDLLADSAPIEREVLHDELQDLSPEEALELLNIRDKVAPLVSSNLIMDIPEESTERPSTKKFETTITVASGPNRSVVIPYDLRNAVSSQEGQFDSTPKVPDSADAELAEHVEKLLQTLYIKRKAAVDTIPMTDTEALDSALESYWHLQGQIVLLREIKSSLLGKNSGHSSPSPGPEKTADSPEPTSIK